MGARELWSRMCCLTSCRLGHRWVPANSLTLEAVAGPAVAVVAAEEGEGEGEEEQEAEEEEGGEEEALVLVAAALAPPAKHQASVAVGEAARVATYLMVLR